MTELPRARGHRVGIATIVVLSLLPTAGQALSVTKNSAAIATEVVGPWFMPDRARTIDGSCAGTLDGTLALTGYGFTIPADATILGIEVHVRAATRANPQQSTLRLIQPGVAVSGFRVVSAALGSTCSAVTESTAGSDTDLWDVASGTWTALQINDSAFGVHVTGVGNETFGNYQLDVARITVHYTTPPAAPTGLAALSQPTHVALSWTDNASDETAFSIERATAEAGPFTEIATPGAHAGTGTVTAQDATAACDTTYWYRVRAYRSTDAVYSGYSNAAVVTRLCPDLTVSKAASPPTALAGSPFTWTLTLANGGGAAASFGAGTSLLTDVLPAGPSYGTVTVTPSGGVTGTISCTVDAGTLGCAATNAVEVPVSATVQVGVSVTPPSAGQLENGTTGCSVDPGNVVVEGNEANNACNTSLVDVQVALIVAPMGSGSGTAEATGLIACTWNGTASSGTCSTAVDGGTEVAITATASGGSSFLEWSGCDSTSGTAGAVCHVTVAANRTVVPTFLAPVAAPSGLVATSQPTHVALSWTDNAADESWFSLERATTAAGPFTEIATPPAHAGTGTVHAQDSTATCDVPYWYRVRAFRSADATYSDFSAVTSVTRLCPDLTVSKVASAATAVVGSPFTWTLTLVNDGSAAATFAAASSLLTDALPAGPVYGSVTVTPAGGVTGTVSCSVNAGTLGCRAANPVSVPIGGTVQVAVAVTPSSAGQLVNGSSGCSVDSGDVASESDEANNACNTSTVEVQLALTVAPTGSGSGAAEATGLLTCSWDGIASSGTCTAAVDGGTAVAITATASGGSTFSGWSGCDSTSGTGEAVCHVTVVANRTVVPSFVAPLPAPSDLAAVAQPTHVVLSWTDGAADESSFSLERATAAEGPFTEIATPPAHAGTGTVIAQDATAACDIPYWYRVRAYRSLDDTYSGFSNVASATRLCPDLMVTKATTAAAVVKGGSWTWTLTIGNAGAAPASFAPAAVVLDDPLPSGVTYGSPGVTLGGGTSGSLACAIAGGTLTCTASTAVVVPVGGTVAVGVPATGTAAGTATNGGAASGCAVDPGNAAAESVEGNNECNASAVAVRLTLTVAPAGGGSGTASASSLLACTWNGTAATGTCSAAVDAATAVAVTASPGPGATFGGWSDCDSTSGVGGVVCNVTLSDHRTVVPAFLAAGSFFAITPCRLLDTRQAEQGPALVSGVPRNFGVAGKCGVPATARSVAINVTITGPTGPGHVTLYTAGGAVPATSTLNFPPGLTRANNAVLELGAAGQLASVAVVPGGSVHLIVDVTGYFE